MATRNRDQGARIARRCGLVQRRGTARRHFIDPGRLTACRVFNAMSITPALLGRSDDLLDVPAGDYQVIPLKPVRSWWTRLARVPCRLLAILPGRQQGALTAPRSVSPPIKPDFGRAAAGLSSHSTVIRRRTLPRRFLNRRKRTPSKFTGKTRTSAGDLSSMVGQPYNAPKTITANINAAIYSTGQLTGLYI